MGKIYITRLIDATRRIKYNLDKNLLHRLNSKFNSLAYSGRTKQLELTIDKYDDFLTEFNIYVEML